MHLDLVKNNDVCFNTWASSFEWAESVNYKCDPRAKTVFRDCLGRWVKEWVSFECLHHNEYEDLPMYDENSPHYFWRDSLLEFMASGRWKSGETYDWKQKTVEEWRDV